MTLHDDLNRSFAAGNVCAFVGAGLSIGAGLAGWYDLIAELSVRIGYDLPPPKYATGDALIDAAQAYVNRQGLHGLISHLKDRLDTTGKQPTPAHRALARLPISLVFTANFDNLLERTFRDAGKRVEVVVKDGSIPYMRRGLDTVNIVKLYGDLDQPDTIVLARQQYESYFLQRPQMVKLLEVELARSDTLYLGWSGSDPYFKMIFGELLSRFGGMMRPGYAVMFDVTAAQRDELARKQIRLVELPAGNRTAQLARWLESLAPLVVSAQAVRPAGTEGTTAEDPGHPRFSALVQTTPSEQHWREAGIDPVTIPAGRFLYGLQRVAAHIDAFRIAKAPVTNAQYKAFLDATGGPPPHYWQGGGPPKGKADHPVVNVSWEDAQGFCHWAGVRLPNEIEWEKAARGTDGREYPWGNLWEPGRCNSAEAGLRETCPVGRFPQGASPYGVLNMAGNVWEWCADWYDNAQAQRVLRGGSFYFSHHNLGCAWRYRHDPSSRSPDFGFRVVVPDD